ncbi:MAG: hypothetical protein K2P70_13155 [Hyphomonadaceae bacterium]|nr:hypothetical protein [Hyphomonadaceae bacterium]
MELLLPPLIIGGVLALLVIAVLVANKRYWPAIGVAVVCIAAPTLLPIALLLLLPIGSDAIGLGVVLVTTFSVTVIATPVICAIVLAAGYFFRERRREERSISRLD